MKVVTTMMKTVAIKNISLNLFLEHIVEHIVEGVPLLGEAVGDQADDPGEPEHVSECEGEGGVDHDGGVVIGPLVVKAGDHTHHVAHHHPAQGSGEEGARDEGIRLEGNI